jgi:hypothetical protein
LLLLVASATLVLGAVTPCLLPNGGDMTGQPVHDVVPDAASGVNVLPPYQRTPSSVSSSSHPGRDGGDGGGSRVDHVTASLFNPSYRDKPTQQPNVEVV